MKYLTIKIFVPIIIYGEGLLIENCIFDYHPVYFYAEGIR